MTNPQSREIENPPSTVSTNPALRVKKLSIYLILREKRNHDDWSPNNVRSPITEREEWVVASWCGGGCPDGTKSRKTRHRPCIPFWVHALGGRKDGIRPQTTLCRLSFPNRKLTPLKPTNSDDTS
jgi:hypothetical protein